MRDTYHDALDSVTDELVAMSRLVASMMERASAALLEADREKAEAVIEEAYEAMRRRTEKAEALRADAGLTRSEIQSLESLTTEVVLARAGSGGADLDEALRALEAAEERLPPAQRGGIHRTVERLRAQQERARTLSEVRGRWGDAAVDTVLEREREVLDLWGVPGQ